MPFAPTLNYLNSASPASKLPLLTLGRRPNHSLCCPATRHRPLPEHVLIERCGIKPAMPDEAQFRWVGEGGG